MLIIRKASGVDPKPTPKTGKSKESAVIIYCSYRQPLFYRIFLRRMPIIPIKPDPSNNIGAGTGTGVLYANSI